MRLVLNFEPLLPWPLTLVLALALALVVALVAWQRLRGAAFVQSGAAARNPRPAARHRHAHN
jgi:hypothetical protein